MAGWHKPTAPPVVPGWPDLVRVLYLRSEEMEAAEFERLLEVALAGDRPDHPDLPERLPIFVPPGMKLSSLTTAQAAFLSLPPPTS